MPPASKMFNFRLMRSLAWISILSIILCDFKDFISLGNWKNFTLDGKNFSSMDQWIANHLQFTLNLLYAGNICSTVAFFQNSQQHTMIAMSFCPSYMQSFTFCFALGAVCAYIIAAEKCRTLASVNPFIPQAFTCLSNSAFHCALMSLE